MELKLNSDTKDEEAKIKDYLKGFDEAFNIHSEQRVKETPLLINLFSEFVQEIYSPSDMYKKAIKAKQVIQQKLFKNLSAEQEYLFEKIEHYKDIMSDDLIEQAFIYGYSIAIQLKEEAVKQYPIIRT